MKINKANSVFVFDLDDTLYKEADYHESGLRAVSDIVFQLFGVEAYHILKKIIDEDKKDIWGDFCLRFKLPETVKDSLLWAYRLHSPSIQLSSVISDLLDELLADGAKVAILTDGRALTQRLKVAALGLSHIPTYISEEHGAFKPDPKRFLLIQNLNQDKQYIYIADNPKKDFIAPNQLGWITFGVIGDSRNIHSQDLTGLDESYLPKHWLSNLGNLKEFLC